MAPLPAPAEKPSHRVSDPQSHAKVRPPAYVAVFCAAFWLNLQPALTVSMAYEKNRGCSSAIVSHSPIAAQFVAVEEITEKLTNMKLIRIADFSDTLSQKFPLRHSLTKCVDSALLKCGASTIASLLVSALILNTSAWAQELGRKFQSIDVAYPSSGVKLGQGWDSAIGERLNVNCIEFDEADINKASSRFEVTEIKDTYSLLEARNLTASASGSAYGITARASYERSNRLQIDTEHLNYLLSYILHTGGAFVVAVHSEDQLPPEPEAAVAAVTVTPPVRSIIGNDLSERAKKIAEFEAVCGDYFVSAIHKGARINVLATYASKSRSEQQSIKASVEAKGFGATVSASRSESTTQNFDHSNFRFVIDQEGLPEGLAPTISKYEDLRPLVENARKDGRFNNTTAYLITLTPYRALWDWKAIFGGESYDELVTRLAGPNIHDVAALHSAYEDLYALLLEVENEHILNQFSVRYSVYSGVVKGKLVGANRYLPGVIELFGGESMIRASKLRARLNMWLMQLVFDFCVVERLCRASVEVEDLKKKLQSTAKGFKGAVLTEDTATPAALNDGEGSGGDQANIAQVRQVMSKLIREFAKANEAPDVQAHLDAIETGLETSVEKYLSLALKNYYAMLSAIPLPRDVFEVGRIVNAINSKGNSGEEKEVELRLLIHKLIYYERLMSRNEQFCARSRARFMCLSEDEVSGFASDVVLRFSKRFFLVEGNQVAPGVDRSNGAFDWRCWQERQGGNPC